MESVDDLLDPTPDVHALFDYYNKRYFESKLDAVSVDWSNRMTLCAGICKYNHRNMQCEIRLSEPLLKFRPRKDIVSTLLHECIHAYLFVTRNNKDRDDHGPEFQKWMNKLNEKEGTHISIYHDFRDEVALYQTHWWQCQGPCKRIIKRAMNRPPSKRDFWWHSHTLECGGPFIKIKEPPPKPKPTNNNKRPKTEQEKEQNNNNNNNSSSSSSSAGGGGGGRSNKNKRPANTEDDDANKNRSRQFMESFLGTTKKKKEAEKEEAPAAVASTTSTTTSSSAHHHTTNYDEHDIIDLDHLLPSDASLTNNNNSSSSSSTSSSSRTSSSNADEINSVMCPYCYEFVQFIDLDTHPDICLVNQVQQYTCIPVATSSSSSSTNTKPIERRRRQLQQQQPRRESTNNNNDDDGNKSNPVVVIDLDGED